MILQLVISYGWICGLAVIAALATFIIKVFGITAKAGNQLGRMIGFGCGMLLLTESVLGIGMNLGVFPSTTVCMPFLAYGFCKCKETLLCTQFYAALFSASVATATY